MQEIKNLEQKNIKHSLIRIKYVATASTIFEIMLNVRFYI